MKGLDSHWVQSIGPVHVFRSYQIVSDGTIIGNIQAERVRLRRSAIVIGDVTCKSLTMDPDVSLSGKLNVHREAPNKLYLEGDEAPEDEVANTNDHPYVSDNGKSSSSEKRRSKSSTGGSRKEDGGKKEGSGSDRDRRHKQDKGNDESRKKTKDSVSGDSSRSKPSSK